MPQLSPIPRREWLPSTFTHLTVNRRILPISLIHTLSESCLGLLVRDTQVLYTDFSASRQRRLLAFPRCVWVATLTPNSDSAATLNRRFYYSPDSHAAFDCDSKCTSPWVWRLPALHCFGRPNSTAAIHKYPCFVALTLSACVSAHWFRASTLSSYYSDRLSRNQHRREKASILVP